MDRGYESERRYESESDESERARSDPGNWSPYQDSEEESEGSDSDDYLEEVIDRVVFDGKSARRIWRVAHRFDLNAERERSFLLISIIDRYGNNDTRAASTLLLLGARPSGKDLGETSIYVAMKEVHKKFLYLLLRAGADVNEPFYDVYGRETTPFRDSLGRRNPYIMNLFMRYGGRISSDADFRKLIVDGNLHRFKLALQAGLDPLARHDGLTHLEALCYNRSRLPEILPAVRWLMDHGATLTQRTPEGGPLISYLLYQHDLRKGHAEVMEWFLGNGAGETVEWEDRYGDSPLSISVASNAEPVVLLLLSRGVKPDSGDAMRKAKGEVEYHPESLRLIRPMRPVSERMTSLLRGET